MSGFKMYFEIPCFVTAILVLFLQLLCLYSFLSKVGELIGGVLLTGCVAPQEFCFG